MPTRRLLANAIRILAMDAVQKANSGHPGMPMGMADIAEVLWNDFLYHNPANPNWFNRDRFILSNGHGAMLQYALLHLTGYDLTIEDIKQFRQLHSRTPGHPELGFTKGVETTTGPLGQGLANAVGMAIAEKKLASEFNREGHSIIDHYTYVFVGDGCLMEGISHEVCSLAGILGLGKLITIYDDNGISIDGKVADWFLDDTPARFKAYGWHVIPNVDGHDPVAIKKAIFEAKATLDKPSLICCQTVIAYGAPNLAGSSQSHGSPLGETEIAAARDKLDWHHPPFVIPQEIYESWNAKAMGAQREKQWEEQFNAYTETYPELARELRRRIEGKLPLDWKNQSMAFIRQVSDKPQEIATRKASQLCLDAYGALLPELFGGSADLTGSNLTWWKGSNIFNSKHSNGNYLFYGVREFGMFAIMNGIALHGGLIPYGGTFLTFVDYGKNAVRLSALMKSQVIYVLTHDSIGLGEDGPTHQPIEHIATLRLIPDLDVWRPADMIETAVAWKFAIEHKLPTCLLLSRQNLPALAFSPEPAVISRGGYILMESNKPAEIILIATGSEVSLAVEAANKLQQQDIAVRVVSMPCVEVFERQEVNYQEEVLPKTVVHRIIIEAGATATWYKYAGCKGAVIGIDRFGESAPYKEIFKALGITIDHITQRALDILRRNDDC